MFQLLVVDALLELLEADDLVVARQFRPHVPRRTLVAEEVGAVEAPRVRHLPVVLVARLAEQGVPLVVAADLFHLRARSRRSRGIVLFFVVAVARV